MNMCQKIIRLLLKDLIYFDPMQKSQTISMHFYKQFTVSTMYLQIAVVEFRPMTSRTLKLGSKHTDSETVEVFQGF